jgi:hypothetical protein
MAVEAVKGSQGTASHNIPSRHTSQCGCMTGKAAGGRTTGPRDDLLSYLWRHERPQPGMEVVRCMLDTSSKSA